jgi:alkylated DNA nucleotide flippase Atl1
MRTRKTWREKMEREAKLVPVPARMWPRFGPRLKHGKMLIPSPLDVDERIRKVPRGKLITHSQIRDSLAQAAGAACACPITTGIFVRIVAEAAAEQSSAGELRITPYWRVIRDDGRLLENLPGGPVAQAERLEAEGHSIDRTGRLRVKEPARVLVRLQ